MFYKNFSNLLNHKNPRIQCFIHIYLAKLSKFLGHFSSVYGGNAVVTKFWKILFSYCSMFKFWYALTLKYI